MKPKHKKNDIVLVKSVAGDSIPHIHVKLKTYEYVPRDGSWGGYGGWMAEALYEEELVVLRKKWSIPLKVGDLTFVHDGCIIEKENDELQSKT